VIALAGFAVAWLWAAGMVRDVTARRWVRTPCQVIHSEVRSQHAGGCAGLFLPVNWADVAYVYWVDGRVYQSNRYNFTERSTPWYYGKRRIVERYPAGQQALCYVDPDDPSEAVLSLGWRRTAWFILGPLAAAAMGLWLTLVDWKLIPQAIHEGLVCSRIRRNARPAAIALVAGFALQVLVALGSDLVTDVRAGRDDVFEWSGVLVAGLVMLAAIAWFIRVVRALRKSEPLGKPAGP
jgi:hypothetical protein